MCCRIAHIPVPRCIRLWKRVAVTSDVWNDFFGVVLLAHEEHRVADSLYREAEWLVLFTDEA
jgi:hypothetical protein